MEVWPIRTERDYEAMLREVSALVDLDPEPESPEGERLEVLSVLVQAYEARHHPIAPPDPIEAIKFRMEHPGREPDRQRAETVRLRAQLASPFRERPGGGAPCSAVT